MLYGFLHDWPDHTAISILHGVGSAMSSDSVLLVVERVVLDEVVEMMDAVEDWSAMVCSASKVRTKADIESMLRNANFVVTSSWTGHPDDIVMSRTGMETGMKLMIFEARRMEVIHSR